MGTFNTLCGISNVTIHRGEPVVLLLVAPHSRYMGENPHLSLTRPTDRYMPVSFALRGVYDDCGFAHRMEAGGPLSWAMEFLGQSEWGGDGAEPGTLRHNMIEGTLHVPALRGFGEAEPTHVTCWMAAADVADHVAGRLGVERQMRDALPEYLRLVDRFFGECRAAKGGAKARRLLRDNSPYSVLRGEAFYGLDGGDREAARALHDTELPHMLGDGRDRLSSRFQFYMIERLQAAIGDGVPSECAEFLTYLDAAIYFRSLMLGLEYYAGRALMPNMSAGQECERRAAKQEFDWARFLLGRAETKLERAREEYGDEEGDGDEEGAVSG